MLFQIVQRSFCVSRKINKHPLNTIPVLSSLRSIPVRSPLSQKAGKKAKESRPAKLPEGFSLDAAAVSGTIQGARMGRMQGKPAMLYLVIDKHI